MKDSIKIELIDSNPHRDLERNPLSPDQVSDVAESIKRTGFWDNLVVRPVGDRYQLAYGHNRLAALKQLGIEEAGFSIRELSDFDMLNCMIDENETQRQISPTIIFENLTAAVRLGERMLNESSTVEEFNARMESVCSPGNKRNGWAQEEFTRAKSQIASGEGLGRGFLTHFLEGRKSMRPETVQTVLDTYYAESRKAAAEKRRKEQEKLAAEKAKEQEKQKAEAERKRGA
jgi:ParB-like chromosome segregation protein Spo0J